jgi:hypothetical protein
MLRVEGGACHVHDKPRKLRRTAACLHRLHTHTSTSRDYTLALTLPGQIGGAAGPSSDGRPTPHAPRPRRSSLTQRAHNCQKQRRSARTAQPTARAPLQGCTCTCTHVPSCTSAPMPILTHSRTAHARELQVAARRYNANESVHDQGIVSILWKAKRVCCAPAKHLPPRVAAMACARPAERQPPTHLGGPQRALAPAD